jgi:hypothetical protein
MRALCACGRELHYDSPFVEALVQDSVDAHGPTVPVQTKVGTWLVPKHYYALHGVEAGLLPALAVRYCFERIR